MQLQAMAVVVLSELYARDRFVDAADGLFDATSRHFVRTEDFAGQRNALVHSGVNVNLNAVPLM